jgi:hypothetical protein
MNRVISYEFAVFKKAASIERGLQSAEMKKRK